MKTTSVHIEGQIISPEIFDRLESNEIPGQQPQDFEFEKRIRVKDEIAIAWANAKDQWHIFKRNIEKLKEDETGTSETRRYWIVPLLGFLGYELSLAKAEEVNGNSFAVSHRDQSLEGFPIHIMGVNDSLDRPRKTGGPRLSPHALIQEYLNITEHLYGIVTNGYQLRLLRDSGKLIRLTYLEFDLFQMLEDDLYAEFSIMYRLLHSSRMPQKFGEGDTSLIEQYHQLSLEAGARIREKLSSAVERSLVTVANGFLKNSSNNELRKNIRSKVITEEKFYQYLLRFVYRILFLMVLEERDLIYPNRKDDQLNYFRDVYYDYYSISRIRMLSENIFFFDEKLEDLWIALRNTFKIFGNESLAEKLGIYPLNGDLFDFGSLGILSESNLDNHSLLECIKNLSLFENPETKTIIRVNYAALNVEEFGSVYEGLLEQKATIYDNGNELRFGFEKSDERSSSGSHYTPEELVQPLIKNSLDYVIKDKLYGGKTTEEKEKSLLSIKVCDVACGSGHILLSAARRIAQELTKVRTGEDQPSPEPYRQAIRDVINDCIYGVDKNPLAVELCKVALWLESHNPGMPLNFLDHKIRCGDSVVGLARIEELQNGIATEAFKTLPGDDKDIAAAYRKQNKSESESRTQLKLNDTEEIINNLNTISIKFKKFNLLPDTTVDEVKKKHQKYDVLKGNDWMRLKELADIQVAQFFINKTNADKEILLTDAEYFRIFAGRKNEVNTRKISTAMAVAVEKKIFHWFLEFPEVMQEGGFDCILGNPPFLGGSKITGSLGDDYFNWLKFYYKPASGLCDLVGYFFRKIFILLKNNRFMSLLSTNTISQGDTREGSLNEILRLGGNIIFVIRSMKWVGVANLYISIIAIFKGKWNGVCLLDQSQVPLISSYFDDIHDSQVYRLNLNSGKIYLGSKFLGEGFIIDKNQKEELIKKDENNRQVIFPLINGKDINDSFTDEPERYIINFFSWDIDQAKKYDAPFDIVERKVKPERLVNNDKLARDRWWNYLRPRPELYSKLSELKYCFIIAKVTKYFCLTYSHTDRVFTDNVFVFVTDEFKYYSILQSTHYNEWTRKFSSSLANTLNFAPTDSFYNFPFPQKLTKDIEAELEIMGKEYHEFRRLLMLDMQLGLTKIYNLFHNPECSSENIVKAKEIREFKQANLQVPIEEAIQRVEKLRALHKQMDETVLKAYSWVDINLAHNFYEVDYLPENDRMRYTISPEARKEILKRLVELNHKIHEEEVAKGLWNKKGSGKNKKVTRMSLNDDQVSLFGNG